MAEWVCNVLQSIRKVVAAANWNRLGGKGKLQYLKALLSELTANLCFTVLINLLFEVVMCRPMLKRLRAMPDSNAEEIWVEHLDEKIKLTMGIRI